MMVKVKELCFTFVILAYFLSWGLALLESMDVFTMFPLLAYVCTFFGLVGGGVIFFVGVRKDRVHKSRGIRLLWYTSSSLLFGTAFLILGLFPLLSALHFLLPLTKMQREIVAIARPATLLLYMVFMVMALVFWQREKKRTDRCQY